MKTILCIILTFCLSGAISAQTDSLRLIELEAKINLLEKSYTQVFKNDSIKSLAIDSLSNKIAKNIETLSKNEPIRVIESYRLTNERVNNQLTFIGIIATIFGVIIALGTIYIGFESIKSSREKKQTLKTLEEAKLFVENKKNEFDQLLKEKFEEYDKEYSKLIKLSREQLIESIDSETIRLKEIASLKTKEIEDIKVETKPDELIENFSKKFEFFESIGIPDDPKILLSKAKLLSEKKMHIEAIKLAEKLVEIEPNNANGYWRLGWEYAELDKHDESVANYKKVIEINPKDSSAHNNMAVRFEKSGLFYDALKEYDIAIGIAPESSLYHRNRGRVLFLLKSNEEGISAYRKSIELAPKEEYTYEEVIKKLKELNRLIEVEEFYNLAIQNIPDKNLEFNFNKAEFYTSTKGYENAIEVYKNLIDNNYKSEECRVNIAKICLLNKDYEEALSQIDEAISLNPKPGSIQIYKVQILIKKDIDEAKSFSKTFLESVSNENYHFQVARHFAKNKEVSFAKEIYEKALALIEPQLVKQSPGDFANYIECLISTGKYKAASEFYQENKDSIKEDKYRFLIEFLLIIKEIVVNTNTLSEYDLTSLKEYYSTKENYATWNFEDILYMTEDLIEKSVFDSIKTFIEFTKGKKDISEIDEI